MGSARASETVASGCRAFPAVDGAEAIHGLGVALVGRLLKPEDRHLKLVLLVSRFGSQPFLRRGVAARGELLDLFLATRGCRVRFAADSRPDR